MDKRLPPQERPEDYQFRWSYLLPRYWLLWIWFGVLWAVTRLPIRWVRGLSAALGGLFWHLMKGRRRITLRNLELCFPEKSAREREQIARTCFAEMAMTLFESGIAWWPPRGGLQPLLRVHNREAVEQLLAQNENILIVGLHNVCVEIAQAGLVAITPLGAMYRVHDNPLWEYVAGKRRFRYPLRMMGRKSIRNFIDLLGSGIPCFIVPDQDMRSRRAVFAPFFNIQTSWITSVGDFAARTGAKVVFFSYYRSDDGRYDLYWSDPLEDFPSGDRQADAEVISAMTEAAVRRDPTQYLWAHRRFKTRPPGEPKLY